MNAQKSRTLLQKKPIHPAKEPYIPAKETRAKDSAVTVNPNV